MFNSSFQSLLNHHIIISLHHITKNNKNRLSNGD